MRMFRWLGITLLCLLANLAAASLILGHDLTDGHEDWGFGARELAHHLALGSFGSVLRLTGAALAVLVGIGIVRYVAAKNYSEKHRLMVTHSILGFLIAGALFVVTFRLFSAAHGGRLLGLMVAIAILQTVLIRRLLRVPPTQSEETDTTENDEDEETDTASAAA